METNVAFVHHRVNGMNVWCYMGYMFADFRGVGKFDIPRLQISNVDTIDAVKKIINTHINKS